MQFLRSTFTLFSSAHFPNFLVCLHVPFICCTFRPSSQGKYSYNSTDIHVGDELRQINGLQVSRMSFEEVMTKLKDAVAAVSADYRSQRYGMDDTNRPNSTLKPGKLLKSITGGTISIATGGSGPTTQIVSSASSMQHGRRLILTFRTVEERRMRIRTRALRTNKN